jgi:hypothetical protein
VALAAVRAHGARDLVVEVLRSGGADHLERLELPDTAPVVIGEIRRDGFRSTPMSRYQM